MFYDNQVLGGFILSKLYEGLFIFPESLNDDALEKSIDTVKSEIESLGGLLVSSVSSKTDYLIAGNGIGPSKKNKAEQLNISIISEKDFISLKKSNNNKML